MKNWMKFFPLEMAVIKFAAALEKKKIKWNEINDRKRGKN